MLLGKAEEQGFRPKPSILWIYCYIKQLIELRLVAVQVDVLNVLPLRVYRLSVGITSSVCKEGNIVSSKIGAGVILKSFLNMEIDVDNLPEGNEEGISIETVIPVNDAVKEADNVIRYR